ncbi:MAG: hypothetical protein RLZZ350_1686 [Verrucomicrobiota bacterium]|jgi:tetratricopeptide (TPR) repeat protein
MSVFKFITHFLLEALVFSALGVTLWRWVLRSRDDPSVRLTKIISTVLLGVLFWRVAVFLGAERYAAGNGGQEFAVLPFVAVFCAIVLSIFWTPEIGDFLTKPITSMIDGGDEEVEARAFYSVAKALLGKGKITEAIAEVERQLQLFPGDPEGFLLLAEIQSKNLHDLAAADATIQRFCALPKKTPAQISSALTAMADWHMELGHDLAAAHVCLVQIRERLPDTEFDTLAAQRLAHLGDGSRLRGATRRAFAVPDGVKNYGLHGDRAGVIKAQEISPESQAAALIAQLEAHPLDTDAREKLAELYANHYQRADLALLQLEELVAQPNQPARSIARWLNRMADLHVSTSHDFDAAKNSLERIVTTYPKSALADLAQNRIERLKLEFKGKEQNQAVKLGTYEQNIGLKYGRPAGL